VTGNKGDRADNKRQKEQNETRRKVPPQSRRLNSDTMALGVVQDGSDRDVSNPNTEKAQPPLWEELAKRGRFRRETGIQKEAVCTKTTRKETHIQ